MYAKTRYRIFRNLRQELKESNKEDFQGRMLMIEHFYLFSSILIKYSYMYFKFLALLLMLYIDKILHKVNWNVQEPGRWMMCFIKTYNVNVSC